MNAVKNIDAEERRGRFTADFGCFPLFPGCFSLSSGGKWGLRQSAMTYIASTLQSRVTTCLTHVSILNHSQNMGNNCLHFLNQILSCLLSLLLLECDDLLLPLLPVPLADRAVEVAAEVLLHSVLCPQVSGVVLPILHLHPAHLTLQVCRSYSFCCCSTSRINRIKLSFLDFCFIFLLGNSFPD